MSIAENVALVKARLAEAERAAGLTPGTVCLVAASKMNDAQRVREAIDAGITVCGENRVQEMLEKNAQGAYTGAKLHFIGHLQKNKVKNVVGTAELIHSVDSLELLKSISRVAEEKGIVQDVLFEVNIGREASKSGFFAEDLLPAMDAAELLQGVKVRGLMAIPPVCTSADDIQPYFAQMQQLFIDIGEKKYDNSTMDFLSMGMTHDFYTAVLCGSNMIRIGTGIFGERDYTRKA